MWWLYLYVGLATAGILVLGILGIRVFAAALDLARQVDRSCEDVSRAAERLRSTAEPLAQRAGDVSRG